MFLLEPDRTPYDLNFRLFDIDVRIHPMFWLLTAILGWGSMQMGFNFLLLWIACVFVSILIHELGHVLVGRFFGSDGHIVLYSFGGLAIGSNALANRWQRVAVSFAGPWAGFVFIGVVLTLVSVLHPDLFAVIVLYVKAWLRLPIEGEVLRAARVQVSPLAEAAVLDLLMINIFWGLLNLLPIFPLDGGQISRELFEHYMRRGNGTRAAMGLSAAVAGLLAINALAGPYGLPYLPGGVYVAILFGLLAVQSYQAMQQLPTSRPWREDYPFWDRERDRWEG